MACKDFTRMFERLLQVAKLNPLNGRDKILS